MANSENNSSNTNPNNIQFVEGTDGNNQVLGAPLTTDAADAGAPGLLRNTIDSTIVKIRPMATPLDQISRLGHVRTAHSMEVEYYSVDTRDDRIAVTRFTPRDGQGDTKVYRVTCVDAANIEPSETVAFRSLDGVLSSAYVIAKNGNDIDIATNADPDPDTEHLVRMGRAATQLDVQSPQFSVLPKKMSNLCQIFKMQIEQSIVMKMSHKEIGWDLTDQQEAAIYDMRLGMEKQFLFGNKMKFYDTGKAETVTLTEGIWHQAGKEISIDLQNFDSKALIDMLRRAFTENSGSRRKILIAGSELIAAINKLDSERVFTSHDQVTSWGIDFSELVSKFGKLYVVFSDVFDTMGMASDGIVIDPEYIQKHVFIPFNAERLDLRGSGQRNTEAIVFTEASCLTLRYPDAHARIIGA